MVYCQYCRKWSENDYRCPYCGSNYGGGFEITIQFSDAKCDKCGRQLPYKGLAWRVQNHYFHLECYRNKSEPPPIINPDSKNGNPKINIPIKNVDVTKTNPNKKSSKTIFDILNEKVSFQPGYENHAKENLPIKSKLEDIDDVSETKWPSFDTINWSFLEIEKNADHEKIKNFEIMKNFMDDPLTSRGQFAIVYKVKSNNKFFALRFFSRKNTGAMKKYKLLHEFYEKNKGDKLSFLIDFEYLVNAIYVQVEKEKKRFPLLKMDWVEGKTLEKFLEELPDKNKIKMVKKYFKKMIDSMEELKIAHGDLHPKNIIVEDTEKLKLVDYDCFYIDEFNNFPMPEIGDKDCQHPNRLNFQFNHEIDRFSALVLYLAISVIEEKPEMVNARKGEFIFSSADYLDPDNSDVFNKILSLSDENRELVKFVIQYCKEKNPNIESLDSLLKKTTQKKTK